MVHKNRSGWRSRLSRALILVLGVCLPGSVVAQAPPLPPPSPQFSADCEAPVYATDKLVCETEALRVLDAEMLGLWTTARSLPWVSGDWIEPQDGWFRRRSLCAFETDHEECARAAYIERIAVLYLLQFPPATLGLAVTCAHGHEFADGTIVRRRGIVLFMDPDLRSQIVSFLPQAGAWTPFVTVFEDTGTFRLERLDGAMLLCKQG